MDWCVGDYDWDDTAVVAAKRERQTTASVRCQVEGCDADMQELRPFYQRLRICETHAKAHSITDASGHVMRFCQQCSKLQPIRMFEGSHRSCAASLDKRRARRSLAMVGRRKAAATSDSEAEEEAEAEAEAEEERRPKRRASKQESGSASGSAGSSGEQSALPSTVKSKLGPRSRGSPGRRARSTHRRRNSNDSGEVAAAATGGSAGPADQGRLGVSPEASAVLFGGGMAAAGTAAGAPPLPIELPFGMAGRDVHAGFMAAPPLPHLTAAQRQHAALLGGTGSGAAFDLSVLPAQGPAGPAMPPLALPSAAAPHLPSEEELELLLQLSPEDLADALLADCDSQSRNRWTAGGQPPAAAALHSCSWPPPPMAPSRPDAAVLPRMAASAANAAAPQSRGSHAPVDSRDSGSRGPEHTHVAPHDGSSTLAAWALQQAGPAQPGLTGWPGQQGGDQLVTLCIKLFGTTPDLLPADLHAQLQTAMALTPTVLQAALRHGCLCLTVSALLSPAELERLHEQHPSGLAAAVAAAVTQSQAGSGAPASTHKLLVQAGGQLAAADAQRGVVAAQPLPASPGSTASQLLAAPRLVTPPVRCSKSGSGSEPIQLVLVGPGLADPSAAVHCRSRGQHQIVTVLRVRRSSSAADGLQEPSTPLPADRRSADSDFGSDDAGAWAPSPAGPAAAASTRAPTAAEAAFEAVSLASGEDALLVQLSAPAQGWGLFELEAAAGPLLSCAEPLLVLPAAAPAAADELAAGLASLPRSEATALLRHLGFAMQMAEQGPCLQPAAVQRVSRLACDLALACGERGWVSAARLLLPAIALAAAPAESSSRSSQGLAAGGKGSLLGCSTAAAAAGLHACKGVAPDQQERLHLLLARMAANDAEDAARPQQAQPWQPATRAQPAACLADWFWAGCNLAAGAATLVMLLRNLVLEGAH